MERYEKLTDLRQKTNGQTRLLYHFNYWDGPLSGVMLWNGKKVWFEMIKEEGIETLKTDEEIKELQDKFAAEDLRFDEEDKYDYESVRIHGAYRLDQETMDAIEFNHALFQKYVGTHTDYKEDGSRGSGARVPLRPDHPEDIGDLKPYSEHDKFYKGNEQKSFNLNLKDRELISKFEY